MNSRIQICLLTLLCLFFPIFSKSQNIKGKVIDVVGKPIENANIVLQDTSGIIINYGITDKEGIFEINLQNDQNRFTIVINAYNFKKLTEIIYDPKLFQTFILNEMIVDLKEVVIKSPPVNARGDTINYDVNFFKKPQNRVIGDVLKNIPGIEITEKGQISYNGQAINKFYIDGDDILGGKYNLAENTIPADLVDKVQIFERHQPIEVLRKTVRSQQPALNLTLKDHAKLRLIGEAEIIAGTSNNYLANSNTLLLRPKFKTINRIGYNSIGLNFKDELVDHSINSILENLNKPFATPIFSPQNVLNPSIDLAQWSRNNTGAINLNGLLKLAEKQTLKLNIGYIPEKTIRRYSSITNYYLQNADIIQLENQELNIRNSAVQVSAEYEKNSSEIYIQNKININIDKFKIAGDLTTEKGSLVQIGNNKDNQFDNTLAFIKLLKKDVVLNFRSKIGYNTIPENVFLSSNIFLLSSFKIDTGILNQNINKNSKFTNNRISVGFITGKIKQNYSAELNRSISQFNSEVGGDNKNYIFRDSTYSSINILQTGKTQFSLNPTYSLDINKVQINAGISLKGERYNSTDLVRRAQNDTLIMQPMINVNLQIKPSMKHSFQINFGNDFQTGQAVDLLQGLTVRNYRTAVSNDFFINSSKTIATGLLYSFRDAVKILFSSGSLNYINTVHNSITESIIDANGNLNFRKVQLKNISQRYLASFNLSKYIYALSMTAKMRVDLNFSKQNILQNKLLQKFTNNNYTVNFNINGKIYEDLNVDLETTQNLNLARTYGQLLPFDASSRFNEYKGSLAYMFKKTIMFETNVNYQNYKAVAGLSQYLFSDSKLVYTAARNKTTYTLGINNTFNAKSFVMQSIDANSSFYQKYFLRPRVVYLSLRFLL